MNNKTLCPSLLLCLSLLAPLSCLGETAAAPYPLAHPPRLADYLPPPPAANSAAAVADLGAVRGCGFAEVEGPFDLVVNGTSASLAGDVPPLAQSVIEPGRTVCYDMMYAKEPTAFNRWAAERGAARTLDGLGMLVEQAAEAFFLWRGVRPASAPVLETLRRQLATV